MQIGNFLISKTNIINTKIKYKIITVYNLKKRVPILKQKLFEIFQIIHTCINQ